MKVRELIESLAKNQNWDDDVKIITSRDFTFFRSPTAGDIKECSRDISSIGTTTATRDTAFIIVEDIPDEG